MAQFPLLDHNNNNNNIAANMEFQFPEFNHHSLDNYSNLTNSLLFNHQTTHNFIHSQNLMIPSVSNSSTNYLVSAPQIQCDSRKRKVVDTTETSNSMNPKNISRRGKKAKEEEEKPKEVVHVRARRGQATDSHSLAERVRRGKINERLKCLQDIVPGCYKTMGMAVMLDEIINYVQSLQNQVEFLSMKLTAASTFYDFNSETDHAIEIIQRAKAQEMERGSMSIHYDPSWSI